MLTWFESLNVRLRRAARRWLPGLLVRVTPKDIDSARLTLAGLTEEELGEGGDAVKRAIQAAREREGAAPPGDGPS